MEYSFMIFKATRLQLALFLYGNEDYDVEGLQKFAGEQVLR